MLKLTLVYNESNAQATAEPILIAAGPRGFLEEMYAAPRKKLRSGDTLFGSYPADSNAAVAREIAGLAVRKSPFATALTNAVLARAAKPIR